ncbi:DNA-binding transcriptional MocR family regulator [Roseibium hamelinense]|uniref:DNA-binding transcriptional MocR family regulator n=1 Tax=Roseibium hamelinense TaxID=150831 RepID=A0A562TJV3_9HYPH|nr:PLP-dependent aminotransferase family protein [Roseibium hamelinense]TWI93436.1 DNA-binding transcriptional MocR family regulator [Roseibium hamelinense]
MNSWTPALDPKEKPIYLAIVSAIESDLGSGRLRPGAQLPPQRKLADILDVDFTTVSRAYAEGRRRGLLEAVVGRGTFVKGANRPAGTASPRDMSMNQPPVPTDPQLGTRIAESFQMVASSQNLEDLMRYQIPGGSDEDREAGAAWLSARLPDVETDKLMLFPGTQSALSSIIGTLVPAGQTLAAEALCYPGVKAIAAQTGFKISGIEMDCDGVLPEAFARICTQQKPAALYLNPTLHNPTTATLALGRRLALIEIARKYDVPIVEDDAYGCLCGQGLPPLAALAPDITYHVSGLSKGVSPALRVAYAIAPDRRALNRLVFAARSGGGMMPPLSSALATHWISTGLAADINASIRHETRARAEIASACLEPALLQSTPDAFHAYLHLPQGWTRGEFVARLHGTGIHPVPSDAFALTQPPETVRLSLGTPATRDDLARGLTRIGDLLSASPAMGAMIV